MATVEYGFFQDQLLERKQKLENAIRSQPEPARLQSLLDEVDAALSRLEDGSFGLCETCHEPIETERLVADPLVRFCLDHLTTAQRRALEQDLELAARIQTALLPKKQHQHAGWNVCYHYVPHHTVSGDYCDLLLGPDNREVAFLVGDVSGKGVGASILMAHLNATFRALSGSGIGLDRAFAQANRLFCESTMPNHYATVAGARCRGSDVEICNAGHCPPLVVRGGLVTTVPAGGLPIGMFCASEYQLQRLSLAVNDSLVLYSDGVLEARREDGEEFGLDRLVAVVSRGAQLAAPALLESCRNELRQFLARGSLHDDLTILVAQRVA